jgi:hypothetical protein
MKWSLENKTGASLVVTGMILILVAGLLYVAFFVLNRKGLEDGGSRCRLC